MASVWQILGLSLSITAGNIANFRGRRFLAAFSSSSVEIRWKRLMLEIDMGEIFHINPGAPGCISTQSSYYGWTGRYTVAAVITPEPSPRDRPEIFVWGILINCLKAGNPNPVITRSFRIETLRSTGLSCQQTIVDVTETTSVHDML